LEYSTTEVVNGWISAMAESTQKAEEISDASVRTIFNITSMIISAAVDAQLSSTALSYVLTSINQATAQIKKFNNGYDISVNDTIKNLQLFSSAVAATIAPGQNSIESTFPHFRLSIQSLVDSSSLTLPLSPLEKILGATSSSVSLPSAILNSSYGGYPTVSIIKLRSGLYSSYELQSNPLVIYLSTSPCGSELLCHMVLIMQNSVPVAYSSVEMLNVSCQLGESKNISYICKSGTKIVSECNGTVSKIVQTHCPPVTPTAVCLSLQNSINYGNVRCRVLEFSTTNTTCYCVLGVATHYETRRLSSLSPNQTTFSINIGTMVSYVMTGAQSTILSAQDLNSSSAANGWTVLVTVGGLAVAVILFMAIGHNFDNEESKKSKSIMSMEKMAMSTSSLLHNEKVRKHIVAQRSKSDLVLIDESLPQVLSENKSFLNKFKSEVQQHHRWAAIMYHYSVSFPRSLRVLSLAANIIVMLFVQSMTYNLTNQDDGSCKSYTTKSSCEMLPSSFENGQSKCEWHVAESSCTYVEPANSFTIVIFVAIFSAVVSAPIAIFQDYIICSLLAAPIGSDTSGNKQQQVVSQVDHSASTMGAVERFSHSLFHSSKVSALPDDADFQCLSESIRYYRLTLEPMKRKEFDGKMIYSRNRFLLSHSALY